MISSIMFLVVETRPDIAFATSVASCFAKNPGHQHMEAVKTILQYLKGSKDRGITYGGQDKLLIEGYLDSDWAGDTESRRSTSGFIFILNGGPVSCAPRDNLPLHCHPPKPSTLPSPWQQKKQHGSYNPASNTPSSRSPRTTRASTQSTKTWIMSERGGTNWLDHTSGPDHQKQRQLLSH